MKDYILSRLRIESARLMALAEVEGKLQHSGLKGRLRELLIDNILIPWLPPYVSCGTGTIIDREGAPRASTQDDVIIYDKSLTPPILSANHAPEGIFLYNSTLVRVEVKSCLNRTEIKKFAKASNGIANLRHTVRESQCRDLFGTLNMLFAYDSDAKGGDDPDFEIKRVIDVMEKEGIDPVSGIVSVVCIPGRGLWKIGEHKESKKRYWARLQHDDRNSHIACFVGCISNSCYREHANRQGRDPDLGIECGIGMYIPSNVWAEIELGSGT